MMLSSVAMADAQTVRPDNAAASNGSSRNVPAIVDRLFEWPPDGVLNGNMRLSSNAPGISWPRTQCSEWVQEVLDASWRPPAEAEVYFLKGEFPGHDVVRLAWNSHGYRIEVSQTASVFAIKLVPEDHRPLGRAVAERIRAAKDLSVQIFNKTGAYNDSRRQGERGTLTNLTALIQSSSFPEDGRVCSSEDGTLYFDPPRSREAEIAGSGVLSSPWEMTEESYEYWFRYIYWWSSGDQIGFYLPKTKGYGPRLVLGRGPAFFDEYDKDFFGEKN
jgi:hypothetical protein